MIRNKWIQYCVLPILGLLATILFLISTEPGLPITIFLAKHLIPGELVIEGAQGKLIGEVKVSKFHYSNQDFALDANQIYLDWRPLSLIHKKIRVKNLTVDNIYLKIKNTPSETNFVKTIWDVITHTRIYKGHAKRFTLEIEPDPKPFLFSDLDIAYDQQHKKLSILAQSIHHENYPIQIIVLQSDKQYAVSAKITKPFNLNFNGKITNTDQGPHISFAGSLDHLKQFNNTLFSINGYLSDYQLKMSFDYTSLNDISNHIKIEGRGDMSNLHFNTILIKNANSELTSEASLYWDANGSWILNITKLVIAVAEKTWTLEKPSEIKWTPTTLNVNAFCLHENKQNACINISNNVVKAEFHQFDLKPLTSITEITHNIGIEGLLDGILRFKYSQNKIENLIAKLSIINSNITYSNEDVTRKVSFNKIEWNMTQNANLLTSDLLFKLSNEPELTAKFIFPNFDGQLPFKSTQAVQGKIIFSSKNLTWFNEMFPDLLKATGSMNLNVAMNGTLEKPDLKFNLTFPNGKLNLTRIGLDLTHMDLDLSSDRNSNFSGEIKTDSGNVLLTGKKLLNDPNYFLQFNVKSNNVDLNLPPEYKLTLKPDLNILLGLAKLDVKGTIDIPKATIQPVDITETLELPSDVELVDDQKKKTTVNYLFTSDVLIRLGNDVNLDYAGLAGEITGDLRIVAAPDNITRGYGSIMIHNGSYKTYGQVLTVEQGKLFYAGNELYNPAINATASRIVNVTSSQLSTFQTVSSQMITPFATQLSQSIQTNMIKVGVRLAGTLQDKKITLFSQPGNISQADILSYLILDKSLSTVQESPTGQEDAAELLNALSVLNLSGNNTRVITDQIAHTFGLDTIKLTTINTYDPEKKIITPNTAIVLGKALSSKLYVDYTFGLLQTMNNLRITYKFSKHWSLQTQTSEKANSGDILYSFEK